MEKKYYKRLVVGSVLFGIIVFGNEVYNNGLWNLSGFFWIAYGAIGFGVLYHILFSCFIKKDDIVNIGLHFFLKNVRPYAASCSEA